MDSKYQKISDSIRKRARASQEKPKDSLGSTNPESTDKTSTGSSDNMGAYQQILKLNHYGFPMLNREPYEIDDLP